jgi:hypothetical protein
MHSDTYSKSPQVKETQNIGEVSDAGGLGVVDKTLPLRVFPGQATARIQLRGPL